MDYCSWCQLLASVVLIYVVSQGHYVLTFRDIHIRAITVAVTELIKYSIYGKGLVMVEMCGLVSGEMDYYDDEYVAIIFIFIFIQCMYQEYITRGENFIFKVSLHLLWAYLMKEDE